jgi:small subunit ribosomal protein S2
MATKTKETGGLIDELFQAGAHFGFVKARRHPSAKPFIFGAKNNLEIFDLEKTSQSLEKVLAFLEEKGKENAVVLFVGGKSEAREAIRRSGTDLNMPFVSGRWIGGTLTNYGEIKKRLNKLEELTGAREKGELGKYTKKERLLIDRDIDKLTVYFGGITNLKGMPKVMIVVDPKKEHIAVSEAKRMHIPVVALAGSDNNLFDVEYPIPANDASQKSVSLIMTKLVEAYKKGRDTVKEA